MPFRPPDEPMIAGQDYWLVDEYQARAAQQMEKRMSDEPIPLMKRFRMWLGGKVFLLAGWIDETYAVWIDTAEPRRR